jgi:Flp pilus assembly protein protease CpaA
MLQDIAYAAAFLLLAIGSITDFRKREVPDWLSYAAIAFGIGLRVIFAITSQSWTPIIEGALGFAPFLILALIMYYAGQWGGGDSKVMMALGLLIGLKPSFAQIPLLLVMLINVVMIGSAYGLVYTLVLATLNSKAFIAQFRKEMAGRKILKYASYAFAALFVLLSFLTKDMILKMMLIMLTVFSVCLFYIWLFVKTVENAIMIKKIPVEKLTEGDWILKDVKIDGKYICGPKDLGIEKKQIALLLRLKKQGKISKIMIKEGIPFVPGLFLAFLATLLLGNWLSFLMP